jgi:hypothetical protein
VVIIIYTGKAPLGALSQPEKNHQLRHFYLYYTKYQYIEEENLKHKING